MTSVENPQTALFHFVRTATLAGALSCLALPAAADSISYTYDALGRVIKSTTSSGATIQYSYDPAGNRTMVSASGTSYPSSGSAVSTPVIVLPLLGGMVLPLAKPW
ncbi:YD repeat-containing protein [Nitrospirillum amazonense]|uniref:YD repeat-containing protein n=1 Tax=Nitrospirillum amazonense TaxID=28077 RepID=A0A560EIZ7_9PROT|nr:RHS repeat domain-containing protein [Nitrospirillum amazonense]TWB09205.1 YD repeat-containing protein [Nitrospirillum amazonense]